MPDPRAAPITRVVVGEYFMAALVWLVPALILLPFYLLLIAISVAASEGGLLEIAMKARGGIHCALGLLLVLGSIAGLVFVVQVADEAIDWVEGGFMVLVTAGVGAYFMHRELRRIATRKG